MRDSRVTAWTASAALLAVIVLVATGCGVQSRNNNAAGNIHGKPAGVGTPVSGVLPKLVTSATGHNETLVAANGAIYAGSDNGNVYAFQSASGTLLWRHDFGSMAGVYAADGNAVYAIVGDSPDTVAAVSAATGALFWQRRIAPNLMGITLADGIIYATVNANSSTDGAITALRASDGTQLWRYISNVDLPSPVTVADGTVYANAYDNQRQAPTLLALDAVGGSVLWSAQPGPEYAEPKYAEPTVVDGVAYIATETVADGAVASFVVEALHARTGHPIWRFSISKEDELGSPVVADGTVYVKSDTAIYALRASDGSQLWRSEGPGVGTGRQTDPLIVSNDALYYSAGLGDVIALRTSDGSTLWQQHITNSVMFMAAEHGRLDVATNLNIAYALRTGDGSLLWQQPIDLFTTVGGGGPPYVVSGGTAYVGTDRGMVKAIRTSDGTLLWRYAIPPKPVLTEPVYSAVVEFDPSVGYAQALRIVTDLGLQPIVPCINVAGMQWQPNNPGDPWSGGLLVLSTPTAPLGWMTPLSKVIGVQKVSQPNPVYSCPSMTGARATPGVAAALPADQAGTPMRITFPATTSYDDALIKAYRLGFRLADPCYENLPAGTRAPWRPMGQETRFAATHALLVVTTRSASTQWQRQAQAAFGAANVQVSPTVDCQG